jgi:hypothetical protein
VKLLATAPRGVVVREVAETWLKICEAMEPRCANVASGGVNSTVFFVGRMERHSYDDSWSFPRRRGSRTAQLQCQRGADSIGCCLRSFSKWEDHGVRCANPKCGNTACSNDVLYSEALSIHAFPPTNGSLIEANGAAAGFRHADEEAEERSAPRYDDYGIGCVRGLHCRKARVVWWQSIWHGI